MNTYIHTYIHMYVRTLFLLCFFLEENLIECLRLRALDVFLTLIFFWTPLSVWVSAGPVRVRMRTRFRVRTRCRVTVRARARARTSEGEDEGQGQCQFYLSSSSPSSFFSRTVVVEPIGLQTMLLLASFGKPATNNML